MARAIPSALASSQLFLLALFTFLSVGDTQQDNSAQQSPLHQLRVNSYRPWWTPRTQNLLIPLDEDAVRWANRSMVYPRTTNSLSSASGPSLPATIGVLKNLSSTPTGPSFEGGPSGPRLAVLVKRDVIKVQESPLLSLSSSSSPSLKSLSASTMSVRIDRSLEPSSEGKPPAMTTSNFNGAICRDGNNVGTEAEQGSGSCALVNNGTKSPLAAGLDGNQTVVTPYYTIVNLDNHNDVLCDEEYDTEEYNENCFIDHNVTCVGDPLYCNLTYDEYRQLLMDYIYPSTAEWILIASHSVVFIMGLVGNALVCIAVYTNHSMRTVTNIFIVNLAVADFFVILFCLPPTVVWDVTETWFMGKAMCKVVIYFQTVSVTVSVLTLTYISIDRWYAICFPLRYKPRPERAWRFIAVIWLIGFLSDLPEFLVLTTRRKKLRFDIKLFTQCVSTWDNEKEKTFYIVKFVFLYSLPLLFMTIAYFQIVRVLWRSDTIPGHRESRTQPYGIHSTRTTLNCVGNTSTMGQLRARRKAAKMLVAVVVMFASCYFPVHMLNVARYTFDIGQSDVVAVLSLFSHWLCYANSAVNPVIYNFMSGKFRREFKNALEKCHCLRNPRGLGGRVGGYDDRSMYHTATRMNASPSSRSNYHLTSHTQQTSFNNGSRHHHARNSINHPGSLTGAPQISPVSFEERMALTKNMDGNIGCGDPTMAGTATSVASRAEGNSSGHVGANSNTNHHHLHHHGVACNGSTPDAPATTTGTAPPTNGGSSSMLMIVNKSSNCKINGT
ncbi:orexin receptor type 2 isoform X2 [Aedes aegypti]|uniref:G-protein coupled receptors family 1 profile domain-containing protein n=1 Tax=Aedes aegypti TaxID=7159 RepID=A0A6R5HUR3_AEDAE|nr:orexin receptor type 2 isoform X2 [Aedes aegypti]